MNNKFIKIATFQGRIREKDSKNSLQKIIESLEYCAQNNVDILCMPESYLHGYFDNFMDAMENSINLESEDFKSLCHQFEKYKTTLIFGLNEKENNKVFNTVVIIENGICIGKYRKSYTYTPYDYFECGTDFPVFEKNGVKFGIIICFDAAFIEPSRILALNGAQIIFCPSFNRTKDICENNITEYLDKRTNFICRAYENRVWFVSSDIVWDSDGSSVCSGYASILDNKGNFVAKGNKFQEEILINSIPISTLRTHANELIFSGKKNLTNIMHESYLKYIKNRNESLNLKFKLINKHDSKTSEEIKSLLKKAMYLPTDEKMEDVIKNFIPSNSSEFSLYLALSENTMHTAITESNIVGMIALQNTQSKIVIHYISSKEELRGRGIGLQMIHFLQKQFSKSIEAETDDDAVEFYRKCGFSISQLNSNKYDSTRYLCELIP